MGLKWREDLNKRRWDWRLAWWGSTEKEASHLIRLRERHQQSEKRSSQIRAPCVASTAAVTEGDGEPNGQIVSKKRTADGRRQRSRKVIDEKRENY